MRLWRIAGAHHPVWSGEGARLRGGRWNAPGLAAIYAGTSYAITALEILVHANTGALAHNLRYVEATLPDGTEIDRADSGQIPGWESADLSAAQAYGTTWLRARRTLVLLVPSVITRGLDWNAVINPAHPAFAHIRVTTESQAMWDDRLTLQGGSNPPLIRTTR
jgi:RES domain-containing protein